jgi:alpha-ketoglutarate-dependent taurine dioxygenase
MRIVTARDRFVAEVTGLAECLVAERDGHAIRHALITHSLIVIRGMELVPAEQVALTRILGEAEVVTDMRNHHPDSVDILVVNNSGDTPVVGNQCWHSDRSFLPEPTRYTILRAHVVPPSGGDTVFADMVAAYEQLPPHWKAQLAGTVGVHSYDKIAKLRAEIHNKPVEANYERKYPRVRHPVVRLHPETGTPALYINELCLVSIKSERGTPINVPLDKLLDHATDDRFVYRHRWQRGDVLIWDNVRVLHKAVALSPGMPRVLHRTTTAGGIPQQVRMRDDAAVPQ